MVAWLRLEATDAPPSHWASLGHLPPPSGTLPPRTAPPHGAVRYSRTPFLCYLARLHAARRGLTAAPTASSYTAPAPLCSTGYTASAPLCPASCTSPSYTDLSTALLGPSYTAFAPLCSGGYTAIAPLCLLHPVSPHLLEAAYADPGSGADPCPGRDRHLRRDRLRGHALEVEAVRARQPGQSNLPGAAFSSLHAGFISAGLTPAAHASRSVPAGSARAIPTGMTTLSCSHPWPAPAQSRTRVAPDHAASVWWTYISHDLPVRQHPQVARASGPFARGRRSARASFYAPEFLHSSQPGRECGLAQP